MLLFLDIPEKYIYIEKKPLDIPAISNRIFTPIRGNDSPSQFSYHRLGCFNLPSAPEESLRFYVSLIITAKYKDLRVDVLVEGSCF